MVEDDQGDPDFLANADALAAFSAMAEANGQNYIPQASTLMSELKQVLSSKGWRSSKKVQRDGRNGYLGVTLNEAGRALIDQAEQPKSGGSHESDGFESMVGTKGRD